jgi:hypothetical protein
MRTDAVDQRFTSHRPAAARTAKPRPHSKSFEALLFTHERPELAPLALFQVCGIHEDAARTKAAGELTDCGLIPQYIDELLALHRRAPNSDRIRADSGKHNRPEDSNDARFPLNLGEPRLGVDHQVDEARETVEDRADELCLGQAFELADALDVRV